MSLILMCASVYPLKKRKRSKNFSSLSLFGGEENACVCVCVFFFLAEETYREFVTMFKCFEM